MNGEHEGVCYKNSCAVNCSKTNTENYPCQYNDELGSCYKGQCYSVQCKNEGARCTTMSGGVIKTGICKNGTCSLPTGSGGRG